MASMKIKGTVSYHNIGTGFWGITDEDGNQWRPTNLPKSMQEEGKKVSLTVEKAKEQFSIFMWGTAVNIL